MKCPFSKWGKKCVSVCPSFLSSFFSLSPFFLTVRFCFLSSFFLLFSLVGCLSVFVWVWLLFVFPSVFFYTHVSIGLSKPSPIYTYIHIHLCIYIECLFGRVDLSCLHKVYCTNVQPKVNPCPRHQCENTHLCRSLDKLLTSRRELMCNRIEREAGSQGKETKHNFVVRTSREDGQRVTLCG